VNFIYYKIKTGKKKLSSDEIRRQSEGEKFFLLVVVVISTATGGKRGTHNSRFYKRRYISVMTKAIFIAFGTVVYSGSRIFVLFIRLRL